MTLSTPTGAGNVTSASAAVDSAITVGKPSNTANGDALVAFVYFRNSGGTIVPPSGWTQLGPINTVNETFAAYVKPIPSAASETATTYTFSVTGTGSQRCIGAIVRVLGANLSALQDAYGSLAAYTGTTSVALPAVTASSAYTLLMGFAIANNGTTGSPSAFTAPGGMTELADVNVDNGTSATSAIWVGSQVLSAAGATGTRTPTISPTASNSGGFLVTITGIPASTDPPDLGPDRRCESQEVVTVTATISGTVTAWTWTVLVGGVTLSGSGNSRTFTAPASINGANVRIQAVATIGGVDTPPGVVNIVARGHQWRVIRGANWRLFGQPEIT